MDKIHGSTAVAGRAQTGRVQGIGVAFNPDRRVVTESIFVFNLRAKVFNPRYEKG